MKSDYDKHDLALSKHFATFLHWKMILGLYSFLFLDNDFPWPYVLDAIQYCASSLVYVDFANCLDFKPWSNVYNLEMLILRDTVGKMKS